MKKYTKNKTIKMIHIAILAVLICLAYWLYQRIQLNTEKERFVSSEKKVARLLGSLRETQALIASDNIAACYEARPNVFDDKKLYCDMYVVAYSKVDNVKQAGDITNSVRQKIETEYNIILKTGVNSGITTGDKLKASYIFRDNINKLSCSLETVYPSNISVGHHLPDRTYKDAVSNTFGCSDGARAAYFRVISD